MHEVHLCSALSRSDIKFNIEKFGTKIGQPQIIPIAQSRDYNEPKCK